jgi:hypothetical protein
MTLLNAPAYDAHKEKLKNTALIGTGAALVLLVLLTLAGFLLGHGWLFTDLPAEHTVNRFFNALEAKDFDKAYAIYTHDDDWKQHPDQHKEYPIGRFTEDWTTQSPAGGPILSHHVDISKTDGSGTFGTGIIVAVRVKAEGKPGEKKIFMWYQKSDHTLTEPAPHILEY